MLLVGYSASNDPDLDERLPAGGGDGAGSNRHLLERLSGESAAAAGVLNMTLPVELIDRGTTQVPGLSKA